MKYIRRKFLALRHVALHSKTKTIKHLTVYKKQAQFKSANLCHGTPPGTLITKTILGKIVVSVLTKTNSPKTTRNVRLIQ